jgi:hypothetical protein
MIIALLMLILFAILFPKVLRFLFALLFLGGIIALSEVHAKPSSWISYWHSLDEQCRGGSGDDANTIKACNKRSAIDKILADQGCAFRYPDGWPALKGEYWKCSHNE